MTTEEMQVDRVEDGKIKLISTLQGHQDRVWKMCWNPVSSPPSLVSCSGDKSIRLWSASASGLQEWKCLKNLDMAHKRTIRSVAWNPDGRVLASCSFDASCAIWHLDPKEFNSSINYSEPQAAYSIDDEEELECMATLEGHENEVKSVAWSASGSLLATCSRDKSVWIWEALGDGDFECVAVLQEHTQDVKYVKWHPHEEILASCSYDDTIRLWKEDQDDWYCFQTLNGHTSTVWSIDFDSTGDLLASVGDDKSLRVWKKNTQGTYDAYLELADLHSRTIYSVSFQYPIIATCGADNCINIVELTQDADSCALKVRATVTEAHGSQDVNCVVFCPLDEYKNYLASGGDDNSIKIWRV